jgi:hypothetical protein
MTKPDEADIDNKISFRILEIPFIGNDLSFARRVDEDYLIPRQGFEDEFLSVEGLYPCTVVPRFNKGRKLQ